MANQEILGLGGGGGGGVKERKPNKQIGNDEKGYPAYPG